MANSRMKESSSVTMSKYFVPKVLNNSCGCIHSAVIVINNYLQVSLAMIYEARVPFIWVACASIYRDKGDLQWDTKAKETVGMCDGMIGVELMVMSRSSEDVRITLHFIDYCHMESLATDQPLGKVVKWILFFLIVTGALMYVVNGNERWRGTLKDFGSQFLLRSNLSFPFPMVA